MKWDYDERGNAINLTISYREIVRRQWHGRHSDRIPPIWRETVARVIDEHHAQMRRQELAERVGSRDGRRQELRELLAAADARRLARMREGRRSG